MRTPHPSSPGVPATAPAPAPAKLGRRMLHPLQCLDGSHYLMKNLVRNEVARKKSYQRCTESELTTGKWKRFVGFLKFIRTDEFNLNMFVGVLEPMF
jgi:hypothetical protein